MGDVVKMETPFTRVIQIGEKNFDDLIELRLEVRKALKKMKRSEYAQAEKILRAAINRKIGTRRVA